MSETNKGGMPKPAGAAKRPNDDIDLSGFTYKGEFVGDQFKKYCELTEGVFEEDEAGRSRKVKAGLPINTLYDFVGYKVNRVRKRIYPKGTDQTTEVVGFRIIQEEPVRETSSTLGKIQVLNNQIHNNDGKLPMTYYLLKKY
jgi:hypothetical protein